MSRPDVLAFIYPQDDEDYDAQPYDHAKYLVSVDDIESATRLDFFTSLSEAEQQVIESSAATKLWNKIDINSATLETLKTLDGIGSALAQRIIDGRPYETIEADIFSGLSVKPVDA